MTHSKRKKIAEKPKKTPQKNRYYCTRCPHTQEQWRYEMKTKLRPRCQACGGNLVSSKEKDWNHHNQTTKRISLGIKSPID